MAIRHYRTRRPRPVEERILAKSHIPKLPNGLPDNNACWTWEGGTNNAGYGLIRAFNSPSMVTVHRAMGKVINLRCGPKDEIQHTCLNRLCVNPNHLVNGNAKTRAARMKEADRFNGMFFHKEYMWPVCSHCGETTYLPHFKRKHALCKSNKLNKYKTSQILRKSK